VENRRHVEMIVRYKERRLSTVNNMGRLLISPVYLNYIKDLRAEKNLTYMKTW
jgi:hypothetical protein